MEKIQKMRQFKLSNEFLEIDFINLGARITSIKAPNKNGIFENVVLTTEDYTNDKMYLNTICGPTAGRIKNASFEIDGEIFGVEKNDGNHNLHGGSSGFHNVYFDANINEEKIIFNYKRPHNEGGFPGNLHVSITYSLKENNLIITYEANTDKSTLINLTNHAYFNLSGVQEEIINHTLKLPSKFFLETNSENIPTGNLINVENHEFDFRVEKNIIKNIDHPFILDDDTIVLTHPSSGRRLTVITEEKAAVIFTGNPKGICIETQATPDKHNILRPNETYKTETILKFDTI